MSKIKCRHYKGCAAAILKKRRGVSISSVVPRQVFNPRLKERFRSKNFFLFLRTFLRADRDRKAEKLSAFLFNAILSIYKDFVSPRDRVIAAASACGSTVSERKRQLPSEKSELVPLGCRLRISY